MEIEKLINELKRLAKSNLENEGLLITAAETIKLLYESAKYATDAEYKKLIRMTDESYYWNVQAAAIASERTELEELASLVADGIKYRVEKHEKYVDSTLSEDEGKNK